jgi:hypothetical protein
MIDFKDDESVKRAIYSAPDFVKQALRKRYIEQLNAECETMSRVSFWRFLAIHEAFIGGVGLVEVSKKTGMKQLDVGYLIEQAMSAVKNGG